MAKAGQSHVPWGGTSSFVSFGYLHGSGRAQNQKTFHRYGLTKRHSLPFSCSKYFFLFSLGRNPNFEIWSHSFEWCQSKINRREYVNESSYNENLQWANGLIRGIHA